MPNIITHIIIHHRDKDTSTLARAEDGLVIACRQGAKVGFGADPRQQGQHVFIDKAFAAKFLVRIANDDWREHMLAAGHSPGDSYGAHIEDREGDKKIIPAGILQ